MPRKPVKIGGTYFRSRQEAIAHIQAIIRRTPNEQPLRGEDAAFVAALFALHPEYSARTNGRTVSYFTASTSKGASRCFYVRFADGKLQDFSFEKCLKRGLR